MLCRVLQNFSRGGLNWKKFFWEIFKRIRNARNFNFKGHSGQIGELWNSLGIYIRMMQQSQFKRWKKKSQRFKLRGKKNGRLSIFHWGQIGYRFLGSKKETKAGLYTWRLQWFGWQFSLRGGLVSFLLLSVCKKNCLQGQFRNYAVFLGCFWLQQIGFSSFRICDVGLLQLQFYLNCRGQLLLKSLGGYWLYRVLQNWWKAEKS